jgi:hypothetical protein
MQGRLPYLLGGVAFATKDQVKDHYRSVLASTPDGQRVADPAVLALLAAHPYWHERVVGLSHVTTGRATFHGIPSRCFMTVRYGRLEPITPKHSLARILPGGKVKPFDGKADHLARVTAAARVAILDQVQVLAMNAPPGFEVDHAPPDTFAVLLREFVRLEGRCLWQYEVHGGGEGAEVRREFADAELCRRWQQFHAERATLRVLSREAHLLVPVTQVDWSDAWLSDGSQEAP